MKTCFDCGLPFFNPIIPVGNFCICNDIAAAEKALIEPDHDDFFDTAYNDEQLWKSEEPVSAETIVERVDNDTAYADTVSEEEMTQHIMEALK